jgi:hypothetical protein
VISGLQQKVVTILGRSAVDFGPAEFLIEREGGEVGGEAFEAEGAGEALVEVGDEGLADALAEVVGRDEEMMNEVVGFPEGEEAEEGAVGSFGEVDEFAFGVAVEVIELEVLGMAPGEGGATGSEVEEGEIRLVGWKGGAEEHDAL